LLALSCFQILSLTSHFIGSILSNGSKSSEVHFSLNNSYIKSEPEGCNNDSDYENHSKSNSQGNNNYSGSKDKELISDMSSYYEKCTSIEQQEYCSSLEALLNKLCAEGKTNINKIIVLLLFIGRSQGIDNEKTSSAYDIDEDLENDNNNIQTGSEEILEPLYEMQQDTVEDLRHINRHESSNSDESQDGGTIQNKQMYVQQDEETPELQAN
ncbi:9350_t:CDS:2, partial [Cetraspora pellucida]